MDAMSDVVDEPLPVDLFSKMSNVESQWTTFTCEKPRMAPCAQKYKPFVLYLLQKERLK